MRHAIHAPLGAMFAVILAFASTPVWAVSPEQARQAENLVQEALHAEIYGLVGERERMLDAALRLDPDSSRARWQSGQVRFHRQWMASADAVEQAQGDRLLVEYRHVRERYADTVEGQLNLASWCRGKGLAEQERAHLTRALEFDPDHAAARQRLGYRRVNGEWLTGDEAQTLRQRAEKREQALKEWTPRLKDLRAFLEPSRSPAQREAALARLKDIRDPTAIPALEPLFAAHREETAAALIDVFDAMRGNEAILALARLAVASPFENVCDLAAHRLRGKAADAYVPALLAAMSTPAQSRLEIYRAPGGRLMYRHEFLRETQDTRELSVVDTELRRISLPGGLGMETFGRMQVTAVGTALARESNLTAENARTESFNARICAVLAISQEQKLPATPDAWWQWWNDQNEISYGQEKPLKQNYNVAQVTFRDEYTELPSLAVPRIISGGARAAYECLKAGTPVWTLTGPAAIEKVRVGDMVLSQDVETGELAYKPVLAATTRPAGPIVRLHVGRETIETSGGHLFWANGDGWIKSRSLKSGALLHAIDGAVSVSEVEAGEPAPTYNLIVADFNTYFVGESQVLSHDNTPKRATRAVVPGLVER